MASENSPPALRFVGHRHLANRLVLSTLTGRPIHVSKIRTSSVSAPGLAPHEVSLLRLLDAITNGSRIEFNASGTAFLYKPGLIAGSAPGLGADAYGVIRHEIPAACERGLSYFLIPLCLLAPFAKNKVSVLFAGPGVITSATELGDVSVDTVRTAILPYYTNFGISTDRVEIRTVQRSCPGPGGKGGAGEVQVVFAQQVRLPKTIHLLNRGRVKNIRGVAYAVGVSGSNNARMIEAARGVLNKLVPDTRIFSENSSAGFIKEVTGGSVGKRKMGIGFGLSLVAETSTGNRYSADMVSPTDGGVAPEEIGKQAALQLLEVISQGGVVGQTAAPTVLMLMAMGPEDASRVALGKDVLGTEDMVQMARDFREFGLNDWGLRDLEGEEVEIVVVIKGSGVGNVGRKIA
ncbi:18S rRNA biogenesis protein [Microthyrium microscopicum]|uniref:18S rRNA biogenesis protein n=1 Tax=Microthyrium microscopicum TaxID=703497 RepID=A0A6A6UUH2_9PEZI|nr:18S rRNA biogenesis protein [Microthyrium microscopicum]